MKPDDNELQQQLKNLKERLPGLSTRLSQAAVELKEAGVPVDESAIEQTIAYRRDFAEVRSQIIELAKSKGIPGTSGVVAPSQVSSLLDLEGILHAIATSPSTQGNDTEKALAILDRFLALTHRDLKDFPPLQAAQEKGQELRRIILNAPANNLPIDVETLISGKHPCCALLTLIDPEADISDEQWGILVEVAARAFGKPLTVAASRGKLQVSPHSTPSTEPPVQEPKVETPVEASSPPPPVGRRMPEMVVIAGDDEPEMDAESEAERLLLDPPKPSSDLPDVIVLPSMDESPTQGVPQGQQPGMESRAPAARGGGSVGLKVLAHIEREGDRIFRENQFAGTRGQAQRLEGFAIHIDPPIPGLGLRYMAYLQGMGDTPWMSEGEFVGTRGIGRRIEGFAIALTGDAKAEYSVYYRAHIENVGDTPEAANGEFCGFRGKQLRVEGMKVRIEPK
ncbi:hypothetical protein [Phormidium sp. CCY1219]|uniref:hypothetical protein n=1 Tax=Phormidium sp. CCY1219 TaxID=2886104 RepID=UPI002D1F99A1|nr:hypothetical protein [Phormidium sp. CCY1219]MEB3830141.1 hypothetical protein [Phormidium sp. CCY1219]